ncbi:MAG: flagellar export protein FliJ [Desulfobacteraceae bacterium]|nr:flagellar export protein FliJ [Desulfobacteraceae bacterium]
MKRFSFKLEALLKYRRYLELLAQQEMAQAYKNVQESEMRIRELKVEFSRGSAALDRAVTGGIRAVEFKSHADYLDSVDGDRAREIKRKAGLETVLGEKQTALTRKSVDKKVLERLKDRKKSEYLGEFLKAEQNASDEISSLKKAREITDAIR